MDDPAPQAHRRPIHRPVFDVLERRVLPTTAVSIFPLESGQPYPTSMVPGSDGDLWVNILGGDEVDHVSADGTVTRIPLGPPPTLPDELPSLADYYKGITLGPDANLWASSVLGVARITPSGVVTTYANGGPNGWPPEDDPSSITVGPDGALWFVGFDGSIGRVTTQGVVTLDPLPDPRFEARSITLGPDGALWFTTDDQIGRLSTDGRFEMFPSADSSSVDDIKTGPDGNLWFDEDRGNRIGRITPGGEQEFFPLPTKSASASSLTIGPGGDLWFVEQQAGQVGRIAADGSIVEYPLPGVPTESDVRPYDPIDIAFAPDGALWYTASLDGPMLDGAGLSIDLTSIAFSRPHDVVRVDPSEFCTVEAQAAPGATTQGLWFSGPLATFTPIGPGDVPSDYHATIAWGDGSTSIGQVVETGDGSFEVDGSHTFEGTDPRSAAVTVTADRPSPLPIVLPAVVQETISVGPSVGPIPGPAPGGDDSHGGPIDLPIAIQVTSPSPSPSVPIATLAPVTVTIQSPPAVVTVPTREAGPSATQITASFASPVALEVSSPSVPTAAPTQGSSRPSLAVSSASLEGSTRAGRPVPTAGLAAPKISTGRKGSRPAPRPIRIALAEEAVISVNSLPEATAIPESAAR